MTANSRSETYGLGSCGGCDNRWSGVSRAHCAACHRTFGGATLFDAHRRDGCLDPETIMTTPKDGSAPQRAMFLTDGIWQSTETPNNGAGLRKWRERKIAETVGGAA